MFDWQPSCLVPWMSVAPCLYFLWVTCSHLRYYEYSDHSLIYRRRSVFLTSSLSLSIPLVCLDDFLTTNFNNSATSSDFNICKVVAVVAATIIPLLTHRDRFWRNECFRRRLSVATFLKNLRSYLSFWMYRTGVMYLSTKLFNCCDGLLRLRMRLSCDGLLRLRMRLSLNERWTSNDRDRR